MAPTTPELKLSLKEIGMSQSGDKGTLEFRLARGNECIKLGLKTPDNDPVHQIKLGPLKKHAAKAGVSPIGSLDEVLELADEDDFIGILRLGVAPTAAADLTASSSVAILRKSYLKLSLKLHPDKNRKCPDATKVFQAVVNAFERLSQPELIDDVKNKSKKHTAISRSNTGCKRSRVCCPRCKSIWSETTVEGNPDYFYNFMMTGLKSFNCATCLLEFGCMTAIHKCPFCKHNFEYHPSDFHRKISCGSKRCTKQFGFYMFHCSDRAIKNLKVEVKELREARAKQTEQKRRRAESARRRRGVSNEKDADAAFLMGLVNECPRCGISLAELEDQDEMDHLQNCNDDEGKISANKRKKEALEGAKSQKRQRQELQDDVAAKAAWNLLGSENEDMWLLTDGALEKECAEHGVDVAKGKTASHEMIASLVGKRKSQALTKFDPKNGGKTTTSLPSNLHTMTVSQLRAVAASRGITVGTKLCKSDVIDLIESESELKSDGKGPLMLTDGTNSKKRKTSKDIESSESDSDSDSDSDYGE
ncbi:hypothetical protein FRACYDRAFT_240564 [Fragilariopsis cylindrus CCMP1102]|uniref:J domain-containing protein n=1 Tax=Fragilariopsis cylindrus CCMP1102 TaxID=635003 RepID=A0A1E7FCG2_9STRA|nr:hypothetical protein FRACYDRAFT_240564 [Fragilariopsis cylindrus CCMP1102]|eukprot:OEU15868.1 hypothetical protein FRACYDRAFT_240564 [Fragilariopsis cylindrus CCMP1102]